MAVPWDALRVVGLSFVLAAAYEFVVWFLFHRNSSYGRQLEQLDRLGKRLDAAQADAEADPNNAAKKKAHQRLDREVRQFSLSMQSAKFKLGLLTGFSMFGGMWVVNKFYTGHPVARMPFVPFKLFTNLTHMGLPGDDMTEVSAAFFFAITQPVFRANLSKLAGTAPGRAATKYLGITTAAPADSKKAA